ncbi:TPA: conjugal transfer protein TraM [Legionella pneumophila subsp. pneumophila]|nr:conjugal transfer protein TraM [Legionella pneumophila subsp. pneumophila]HAT9105617.1 conjugal transfer protein TraM [Legionella pneumophila subsp. pneumophila]HAT9673403.1 conjugal transfer protein TraM [Legionella pneumophila subsp. pneumophila]
MTDQFDEAIREIAIRHGVTLSRDDPILILQTMNDRLIEDTQKAQAAMLAQFREEIESISSQWRIDAKEKAEKILNSALTGSKETMRRLLQETTQEIILSLKKITADSMTQSHVNSKKSQRFALFLCIGSMTIIAGTCLFRLLFIGL